MNSGDGNLIGCSVIAPSASRLDQQRKEVRGIAVGWAAHLWSYRKTGRKSGAGFYRYD